MHNLLLCTRLLPFTCLYWLTTKDIVPWSIWMGENDNWLPIAPPTQWIHHDWNYHVYLKCPILQISTKENTSFTRMHKNTPYSLSHRSVLNNMSWHLNLIIAMFKSWLAYKHLALLKIMIRQTKLCILAGVSRCLILRNILTILKQWKKQ